MTRLRDAVVTLICLAFLVPVLVLQMAVLGLRPRHWSGIALSGMDLPVVNAHPRYGDGPAPEMDAVTDELIGMPDSGWLAVIPASGGGVHIEVTRLSPGLFPMLGEHFDGDRVSVIFGPLTPLASYDDTPGESFWQRTDPPGTWLTLMTGFPVPLIAALVLTAIIWADIAVRRRHRPAQPGR